MNAIDEFSEPIPRNMQELAERMKAAADDWQDESSGQMEAMEKVLLDTLRYVYCYAPALSAEDDYQGQNCIKEIVEIYANIPKWYS